MLKLWRRFDWQVMWAVGFAALPLGLLGFWLRARDAGQIINWGEIWYRTWQLYVMEAGDLVAPLPWPLAFARFMAPTVTIYSVGRALGLLFDHQIARLWLRFWKGHVVVLGLGRKGEQVLKDHIEIGSRVVAIEQNGDRETHRRCRDRGAIVIEGSATRIEALRAARVAHASQVFVFCGSDDVNIAATILSSQVVLPRRNPARRVDRYVHVVDPELCASLRRQELFPDGDGLFRTHIVNTFENAARTLFTERILPYAPVAPTDQRCLRAIIVGFGAMGHAVATQLARSACFANEKPLELLIIDQRGKAAAAPFLWQHPGAQNACKLDVIEARADDPDVLRRVVADFSDQTAVTVLLMCLDNDAANLVNAVAFRSRLPHSKETPPIFVRASDDTGIGTLLESRAAGGSQHGIVPFGSVAETCRVSVLVGGQIDALSRQIHENHVANRLREGKDPADPSLAPWDNLSDDLRDSNRRQAEHTPVKLITVGRPANPPHAPWTPLTADEFEVLSRLEHHRWNTERLLAGWTLGPKDLDRKVSPHLISWDQLAEEFREYDRRTVRDLERRLGSGDSTLPSR